MWEQSKSAKRRFYDGLFHSRYFAGNGIDIGGATDPLVQYIGIFPKMLSVRIWDINDGDAQYMSGVPDGYFDFLHSSHCLEHLRDVYEGMSNWIRIVKPGGFLIVTVPDEDLYEQGNLPSRFNPDHKHTFTIFKKKTWSPVSVNLLDVLINFSDQTQIERIQILRDFFRENLAVQKIDQTLTPVAECGIEFILRKNL